MNSYSELTRFIKGGGDPATLGDINTVKSEGLPLLLLNYSTKAQIAGRWNWIELVSRGLILEVPSGRIVARPFPKFFNYGERLPATGAKIESVSEKLDGSLGIIYHYRNMWHVATRGSFNSAQALWAAQELYTGKYDLSMMYPEFTYLVEIIYPNNRVVIDYKERADLTLIGVINRESGVDVKSEGVKIIAEIVGFNQPQTYAVKDINDLLKAAESLSPAYEGFVVRYNDGSRFKVKGEAYKRVHKLLTGFSDSRLLEALATGADLDTMWAGIPDEFLADVRAKIEGFLAAYKDIFRRAEDVHVKAVRATRGASDPREARKAYALAVKESDPTLSPVCFCMYDRRSPTRIIWQQVKTRLGVQDETAPESNQAGEGGA